MTSLFKKETLLMCLVLAFYGIIAGGSIIEFFRDVIITYIIIFVGILVVAYIYGLLTADKRKKAEEEREKIEFERRERLKKEQEEKKQKYNVEKDGILSKYGQPDKVIIIQEHDIKQEIMIFEKINRLWLLGEDIPFGDILSCTYNDNYSVEKRGKIELQSKTETNNGSMIGRAIVGGVLAGESGAFIGGTTASKNTQTTGIQEGYDKIIHNYTVIININNFSKPIVRIPLGKDGKKVNDIVGLMNIIISRNKK